NGFSTGFCCQNINLRCSVILPLVLSSVSVVEPDFIDKRICVFSRIGIAVSRHCCSRKATPKCRVPPPNFEAAECRCDRSNRKFEPVDNGCPVQHASCVERRDSTQQRQTS